MNQSNHPRAFRRAIAPVELLLTLPLLAVLFLMLLTTAAAGLLSFDVVNRARDKAWEARNDAAGATPLNFSIDQQLARKLNKFFEAGPAPRIPVSLIQAGAVNGQVHDRLEFGYDEMLQHLSSIHRQHSLLNGCWDSREIGFDDEKSKQKLTLDRRIGAFSPPTLDLTAFAGLVSTK